MNTMLCVQYLSIKKKISEDIRKQGRGTISRKSGLSKTGYVNSMKLADYSQGTLSTQ